MKLATAVFLTFMIWGGSVLAEPIRTIELHDGSVISGEIISFANGVYTIESSSLGILEIEDAKIRVIRSPATELVPSTPQPAQPAPQPNSLQQLNPALLPPTTTMGGSDLQSLQGLIMNNPETLNSVMSLQNDPDFQSILQDPEIMNAVMSGNFNILLSNPKFMKLLEHQQVKEIQKQLEHK
jgi:hypothetical protein